ncbi:unnamed protein product [Dibothriocephalus latus]|uniref:Uncharacterized protein n=1 Tax=Dibothriocephalus latus TaxID=60516 RepID=A0A3P7P8R8_DIBLA|nr:unnamed protein product [Dibothriocephalus latus]
MPAMRATSGASARVFQAAASITNNNSNSNSPKQCHSCPLPAWSAASSCWRMWTPNRSPCRLPWRPGSESCAVTPNWKILISSSARPWHPAGEESASPPAIFMQLTASLNQSCLLLLYLRK